MWPHYRSFEDYQYGNCRHTRIKGKYNLVEFVYELTVNDPEISTILNIVDENTSNKKILSLDQLNEEVNKIYDFDVVEVEPAEVY